MKYELSVLHYSISFHWAQLLSPNVHTYSIQFGHAPLLKKSLHVCTYVTWIPECKHKTSVSERDQLHFHTARKSIKFLGHLIKLYRFENIIY